MAKRKNLQLERRAAPKQPDKRSDERRKHRPEGQSMDEGQPSIYQSDRDFRERQSRSWASREAHHPETQSFIAAAEKQDRKRNQFSTSCA